MGGEGLRYNSDSFGVRSEVLSIEEGPSTRASEHPATPQQPSTTTLTSTTMTAPTAPILLSQNIFDFQLTDAELAHSGTFSSLPLQHPNQLVNSALQVGCSGRKRPRSAFSTSHFATSASSKKARVASAPPASTPPAELPNTLNYAHYTYVRFAPLHRGKRRGLLRGKGRKSEWEGK